MPIQLMPSQRNALYKIKELEDKGYRRSNVILFGKQQIGKSELAKHLVLNNEKYIYYNFTREFLREFLSGKRLSSLIFVDLQNFLRDKLVTYGESDKIIILDELDGITAILANTSQEKLVLYKQLMEMDQALKFIFITSDFDDGILEKLSEEYNDRIVNLNFLINDKEFIVEKIHGNVNLFEYNEIVNLRQMLKREI